MLYLLLAVALLAVSSLCAVTLLGRRSLVVAGRCRLGGLARGGGRGLALAVTLLLVVSARGVALVLLAVAAAIATAVATLLLLLVVAAAVALLAAIATSVAAAAATALSTTELWKGVFVSQLRLIGLSPLSPKG